VNVFAPQQGTDVPLDEPPGGNVKRQMFPVLVVLVVVAAIAVASGAANATTAGQTLYVFSHNVKSASTHDRGHGAGCGNAAYSTIATAVADAAARSGTHTDRHGRSGSRGRE
jgi:hypothetical protein